MVRKFFFFSLFLILTILASCSYERDDMPYNLALFWRLNDSKQIGDWDQATVPGDIVLTLQNTNFLPYNLYFDHFIQKINWLSDKTWIYKTKFFNDDIIGTKKRIDLILKGVDTYAIVYVNDKKVFVTNDYFKSYRINITPYLNKKKKLNKIKIVFLPPLKQASKFYNSLNCKTPDGFYSILRKPFFHFNHSKTVNYDPIGFYRAPYLQAWDKAIIDNVWFKTLKLDTSQATLSANVKILALNHYTAKITIENQYALVLSKKIHLKPGVNNFSFKIKIKHPKLWYPKNLGQQNIYNFLATLYIKKVKYSEYKLNYGLRKIQISTKNNKLLLSINNIPINLKIAQILPIDIIPAQENDLYKPFILDLQNAGFNAVIPWQGGNYYLPKFYNLCDKYGLLVIQPFMLKYKIFPAKDTVYKLLHSELSQTISQLSQHPSIILWTNLFSEKEINSKLKHWPEKQKLINFSNKIFLSLIPKLVKYYSPQTPILQNLNFNNIAQISDSTIALPPTHLIYNIHQFLPTNRIYISTIQDSAILKFYTRPKNLYWQIIKITQNAKFDSIPSIMYFSQLHQAQKFYKKLLQYRLNPKYNHLLIKWFNDLDGLVISPSAIANPTKFKAKYYTIKNLLQPFIINISDNGKNVQTTIFSESDTATILAYYKLYDFNGNLLWQKVNTEHIVNHFYTKNFDMGLYFKLFSKDTILFKVEIYNNLELAAQKYHFFIPENKINLKQPDLKVQIYPIDNGYALEITPKTFLAKNVLITVNHSKVEVWDNFFNVLPGETKAVILQTPFQIDNIKNLIKVYSYYDMETGNYLQRTIQLHWKFKKPQKQRVSFY